MDQYLRLKKFVHDEVRKTLLRAGRRLVVEKGAEYLTARKLAEASNSSVGTIYNAFSTMENFIAAENLQTLSELYEALVTIIPEANPFNTINRYADVFSAFVVNNRNLWILLYREHLFNGAQPLPAPYRKIICRFEKLLDRQIAQMFGSLTRGERRVALQVLGVSLFALSGFLTADAKERVRNVNKDNLCKLLLNTYLAGLDSLRKAYR